MRLILSALFVLTTMLVVGPAHAQPSTPPDCSPLRALVAIPEIKYQSDQLFSGTLLLSDEWRALPGNPTAAGQATCHWQRLRFFRDGAGPWRSTGDPLPGPTLRAKVGNLVQLAFFNQVDPRNFPNTLDQGEVGNTDGCDVAMASRKNAPTTSSQIYPRNDQYPNCLHGSSTANVHFHGTHTTPSTTGDNVLLFVRPALRDGATLKPDDGFVRQQFSQFFEWCRAHGAPGKFAELPPAWREGQPQSQRELLQLYDSTAPYKGVNGNLPAAMKLWPKNAEKINAGFWPQYSIGAFPYCFPLPAYDPQKVKMGQAPGTHWYHAHKHGSTALNVGNGMAGALIIEGDYDAALRHFYRETPEHKNWGLQEQVLVIQQLESALPLLSPTAQYIATPPDPVLKRPPLSVNGRVNPVITMRPGQVQLWRIVNSSQRQFVQFDSFTVKGGATVVWRQIAQDGVQFAFENYQRIGRVYSHKFNLATANRADLLVRAPSVEAFYELKVVQSISDVPSGTPSTLLTVRVQADPKGKIEPPMDFIARPEDFPKLPEFLWDIPVRLYPGRELKFTTNPSPGRKGMGQMPTHEINGELFEDGRVDQRILVNNTEEWTVSNYSGIAHPFHIHINPFQIFEVFQPNSPDAKTPGNPCYANPADAGTWKPCHALTAPFVWWDTFAIPSSRTDTLPSTVCTTVDKCPANIQKYTTCANNTCTVTIPGYFKFRSRFVDFTGQYVLHCHILAHEDRGMMQLVEVTPRLTSPFTHH
jgi:FtsP/CotA-like multicopper oxidase with cupredoxin domain